MHTLHTPPSFNAKKAAAYNKKTAQRLGYFWALRLALTWNDALADAGLHISDLSLPDDIGSEVFAERVLAYQQKHGLAADGYLGPGTWEHLCEIDLDPCGTEGIELGGMTIPTGLDCLGVRIHPEDLRMDKHGDHAKRRIDIDRGENAGFDRVIVHWGGLNAKHCRRSLVGAGLSSHFLIEPELDENGVLHVYQGIDLAREAYHAGYANRAGIGVDICRSVQVKWKDRYTDPVVMENPSTRGADMVVDLPAEPYGERVRAFLRTIAVMFAIPYGEYPGDDVITDWRKIRGVLGHHNVSKNKWDVAPWKLRLWPGDPSC